MGKEKGKKGLSVITCVTKKSVYDNMVRSLNEHCSCEHEFLSYDNSDGCKSISQVYNMLALQAKYNTLLFVHQDVLFLNGNLSKIVDKINADGDCGYIGFAGSKIKTTAYSGWCNIVPYHMVNYCQSNTEQFYYQATNTPYDSVVTLDGMALFTRKSLYLEYPLDEDLIDNFHCYDLYLTINAFVNGYNNYIYSNKDIRMLHYSCGDYNLGWYETTIRLTDNVWRQYGNLITDDAYFSVQNLEEINAKINSAFLNNYRKIKTKRERKVLYTCITDGYEKLKPIEKQEGWDYVCFTDNPFECEGWDVCPLPEEVSGLTGVKRQRYIKLNPHLWFRDYDMSVWMDGNMTVKGNLNDFVNEMDITEESPIAFKLHPGRNCIYDELEACIQWERETKEITDKLRDFYEKEGFPHNYGLYETNVVLRRHNKDKCIKLMKAWSDELLDKSHRDQLSLTYCIWKLGCDKSVREYTPETCDKYFLWNSHYKQK